MSQKYDVSIDFGTADKAGGEDSEHASERSEFERFEDLTRALITVPKAELDEKRKEREG